MTATAETTPEPHGSLPLEHLDAGEPLKFLHETWGSCAQQRIGKPAHETRIILSGSEHDPEVVLTCIGSESRRSFMWYLAWKASPRPASVQGLKMVVLSYHERGHRLTPGQGEDIMRSNRKRGFLTAREWCDAAVEGLRAHGLLPP